jgi:hypothetical protein
MTLRCWPEAVAALAWLAGMFLLFRVSAFRIDRPGHRGYFGRPYLWNWKYFNPGNFAPEARQLLYGFWLASAIFGFAAFMAVAICV